jgi:plasmid stability protein
MLEIRHGRCCPAEHRDVERPAPSGEKTQGEKTAADLKAPVGDVLVRHSIARDVQRRAE